MKDLSTYALGLAAVLIAAIAVAGGLLATTTEPAPTGSAQPPAVAVQADAAGVAATMNIPF